MSQVLCPAGPGRPDCKKNSKISDVEFSSVQNFKDSNGACTCLAQQFTRLCSFLNFYMKVSFYHFLPWAESVLLCSIAIHWAVLSFKTFFMTVPILSFFVFG